MKARPGKSSNCALKTANVLKPLLILLAVFLDNSEGKLNVFLEAKEVSRFLYGESCFFKQLSEQISVASMLLFQSQLKVSMRHVSEKVLISLLPPPIN